MHGSHAAQPDRHCRVRGACAAPRWTSASSRPRSRKAASHSPRKTCAEEPVTSFSIVGMGTRSVYTTSHQKARVPCSRSPHNAKVHLHCSPLAKRKPWSSGRGRGDVGGCGRDPVWSRGSTFQSLQSLANFQVNPPRYILIVHSLQSETRRTCVAESFRHEEHWEHVQFSCWPSPMPSIPKGIERCRFALPCPRRPWCPPNNAEANVIPPVTRNLALSS